jgi:hypothetical protein
MKENPYGIADFAEIRQENFIYADKTELLYNLVRVKRPYFLSRPRRFGKSLTVSTLEAILLGRRELFKGLWIDSSDYDWTPNPVIHLSLDALTTESVEEMKSNLLFLLNIVARRENLTIESSNPTNCFISLINELNLKYDRKVAILIDEYDAPILNKITKPQQADQIREALKEFFVVIKNTEKYRGFTFITGVTKFTQTSIFSGLNNLVDLTLDKNYSNICGFTLDEFDLMFVEHLQPTLDVLKSEGAISQDADITDLKQEILANYDGYSWDGRTRVLNPWSILGFFREKAFKNFWFYSGSPSFLVNLIKERQMDFQFFSADNYINSDLNAVDIGDFNPLAVMFQAGYLTVKKVENLQYYLKFPNLEVKASLIPLLLYFDKPLNQSLLISRQAKDMLNFFFKRDTHGFTKFFRSLLNQIPHNNHLPYEAYYQTVFILALALADQPFEVEGKTGEGQFDIYLKSPEGDDYIVEIKYVKFGKVEKTNLTKLKKATQEALDQIEKTKYSLKFQGAGNKIYKTGMAIGGRSEVLIVFEEADNWFLEMEQ